MTDTEFNDAKGIVFDNIVRLTNPLGRPPAYDEFLAAAAKAKQILKIYGKDVSAADFDKNSSRRPRRLDRADGRRRSRYRRRRRA